MKKGMMAAVALAGLAVCGQAMADGNSLLTQCQASIRFMNNNNDSTNEFGQGKCLGIVEAIIGTAIIRNDQLPKESRVCFPKGGISNGQGIRIVVKYLQETPSLLHMSDTLLAMVAIGQAYPCK
ncbi:Rap1a/Tai family immunity protein [Pseudomonas silensiensis]|uniref:Rap1a/Tai family immunity protein n=1 Tax=Pseudomonas silensiensis TaxID=2991049 RepID=UPI003D1B6608